MCVHCTTGIVGIGENHEASVRKGHAVSMQREDRQQAWWTIQHWNYSCATDRIYFMNFASSYSSSRPPAVHVQT